MTAEVAILNREAVAMAADSAVTMRRGGSEKIFPSANKIFALSRFYPVGIMVFGVAAFMQLPWETVIKAYRERLGDRGFATLQEYADDFVGYLRNDKLLVTRKVEDRHIQVRIHGYFQYIVDDIQKRVQDRLQAGQEVDDAEVGGIVSEAIAGHHTAWKDPDPIPGLKTGSHDELRLRVTPFVGEARQRAFEKLPLSGTAKRQLSQIATWLFTKMPERPVPVDRSGIVISGFGIQELLPHLRSFKIDGRIGRVLQCRPHHSFDVSHESDALIIPFAQTDVVQTFMEGVEPSYAREIELAFLGILKALPGEILKLVGSAPKGEIRRVRDASVRAATAMFDDLRKELLQRRREQFVDPVLEVVQILPKDELAAMAEALVNLTSFKRHMSLEAESVGGPIDVAVISRGDGLIWIKRKHYFDAGLNAHYLERIRM